MLKPNHRAGKDYQNPAVWTVKSILNVARTGYFSSDRTIAEYARDIWNIKSATPGAETLFSTLKEPFPTEVSR